MTIRRRFATWRFLLIAGCSLPIAIAAADDSGRGPQANQGEARDRRIEGVKTAVITYRAVHRSANPIQEREDVLRLVNCAKLVGNEDAQKKLIVSLDSTLTGKANVWSSCVFTLREKDIRVDSTYENSTTTHVLDDNIEMRSRRITTQGQCQTDLYFRGASHIHVTSLAEFGGRPIFSREEAWQFGTITVKGGPDLPAVVVRAQFDSGKLKTFSMTMIDKVVINEPIANDAFVISGKANDILVDARAKPPNVVSLPRAFDNVLEVLNLAAQLPR
jgi:hypothetical protein